VLAGIGDDARHRDGTRSQDRNTGGPADSQLAGRIRVGLRGVGWRYVTLEFGLFQTLRRTDGPHSP
jgi:hypothetical protein